MFELFVRYFHFLGILILASTLFCEHILISREITRMQLKKLVIIDAIFGISAVVVLIAGLLLWLYLGKPAEFYSKNWIFHLKLTGFVLIGLLSIFPTVFFVRNRKATAESIVIPSYIINIVRLEMLLLVFMPLLAVFMARGYGLS